MQIAPPSWRAAKKRAPASRIALVTARLPLPMRPKTTSTPSSGSARPTASATSILQSSCGQALADLVRPRHGTTRRAIDEADLQAALGDGVALRRNRDPVVERRAPDRRDRELDVGGIVEAQPAREARP